MNELKSITICVPLLNEEELVYELFENLENLHSKISDQYIVNFLLIDDGSEDSTFTELKKYFNNLSYYRIIRHSTNLNLGGFLKTSIDNVNTDFIGFLDSDSTFDPLLIDPMLDIIKNNFDIVSASPYHPKGKTECVGAIRKLISKTANGIYSFILKEDIYTFTSLLKIYRLENVKNIKIETYGFVSVTELYVKSIINGASYYDFPCALTTRRTGSSKIRFLRTIFEHLKFMFRLVINNLK